MWSKTDNPTLTLGVISAPAFTGGGTNDLQVVGRPAFAASRSYRVQIDSSGETYRWSNDGGSTWERTGVAIQPRTFIELRNAEGELEGISLYFTGNTGHVSGNRWDFTTTGTVVQAAETNLNIDPTTNQSIIINSKCAEGMVLHGQYVRGTEDGVILRVYPVMRPSSSYNNQISFPLSLGDGGLRHQQEYFEMRATANFTYRVNLTGIGAFRVTQQRAGAVAATGLLVCFADMYKIAR